MELQQEFYNHEVTRRRTNPFIILSKEITKPERAWVSDSTVEKETELAKVSLQVFIWDVHMGKWHAGYEYYNRFINSKNYHNATVNLLLPTLYIPIYVSYCWSGIFNFEPNTFLSEATYLVHVAKTLLKFYHPKFKLTL